MSKTPQKNIKRPLPFLTPPHGSPPKKSPWKTPKAAGKSEDICGYVRFIGQEKVSRSNNGYYDISVQRSSRDHSMVRVMLIGNAKKRDEFAEEVKREEGEMVQLSTVFPTEEMDFYNAAKNSTMTFLQSTLPFQPSSFRSFTKSISDIKKSSHNLVNVQCRVKYVAPVRRTQSGSDLRNAVLYVDTGIIFLWRGTLNYSIYPKRKCYS